jgi:hypothetical protein
MKLITTTVLVEDCPRRRLVRDDEEERAGRRMPHLGLDRVDRDRADPRRPG